MLLSPKTEIVSFSKLTCQYKKYYIRYSTSKNSSRPTLGYSYMFNTTFRTVRKELKLSQLAIKSEKGGSLLEKRKLKKARWNLKKKVLLHYDKLPSLKCRNRRYGNINSRKRLMRFSFLHSWLHSQSPLKNRTGMWLNTGVFHSARAGFIPENEDHFQVL